MADAVLRFFLHVIELSAKGVRCAIDEGAPGDRLLVAARRPRDVGQPAGTRKHCDCPCARLGWWRSTANLPETKLSK